MTNLVVADAHVHIYPFMSVEAVLEAAQRNLSAAGGPAAAGVAMTALLLVADPEGVDGYERLQRFGENAASARSPAPWTRADADGRSTVVRRSTGETLVAVRGQQLITCEGLEVLGAGYSGNVPSGATLARTIDLITSLDGWAIVAWGVGKWLGRRGRIVSDMIAAENVRPNVMLADNAGRPVWWSRVPEFELAAEKGMRVLAGTDPLPLKGQEERVGSYGVALALPEAPNLRLADAFWRALEDARTPLRRIGARIGGADFLATQIGLRLRRVPSGRDRP